MPLFHLRAQDLVLLETPVHVHNPAIMSATVSVTALLGEAVGGWPAMRDGDLITALLLLVLGTALGIGVTCLLMVVHFLRKGRLVSRRPVRKMDFLARERRLHTPVFHLPSRWLAIRSGNPQLVQAALGLNNPVPCSWEEGLTAAHEQKLFISPAIRGWVLVIGSHLPEPGDDVDKCFRFLMDLSRKLGHVQFFSLNRAVNHHAWIKTEFGAVHRAYAWAGKTLWNQGPLSRAEIDLGLKCHGYDEGEERLDFGRPDPAALNTERLPLLASRWSLDPTSIDVRMLRESQGIAGQLSRSRTH
jgi:hypothetical protein